MEISVSSDTCLSNINKTYLMRYLAGYEFKHYSDFLSVSVKHQHKQVRPIYLKDLAGIMTEWKNWTPVLPRPLSQNTILLCAEYRFWEKAWCSSQCTAEVWFPDTIFVVCCEVRSSKAKPTWAFCLEWVLLHKRSCSFMKLHVSSLTGLSFSAETVQMPTGWLHE